MQNTTWPDSSAPQPHTVLMPSLEVLMVNRDALAHLKFLQ